MSASVGAGVGVERDDEGVDMMGLEANQSFFFLDDSEVTACADGTRGAGFGDGGGPVVDDLEGGAGAADHSGLHGFGDNVVAVRHVCVVEGDACERKAIGRREQRYLCSLRLASQRGPSEVSYGTRIAL